jgi:serine/threonine protein kinase
LNKWHYNIGRRVFLVIPFTQETMESRMLSSAEGRLPENDVKSHMRHVIRKVADIHKSGYAHTQINV